MTVQGSSLEQGDLIPECPVYRVEHAEDLEAPEAFLELHDVVVLTQTCDLVNDKVDEVLVAAVISYDRMFREEGSARPDIKGRKFRKAVTDGVLPAYSLLPQFAGQPPISWSLASFHHLFSVPKALAATTAGNAGQRLRLRSPYRENLAQAFARYMMRVGLPAPMDDFETYTPG